MLHDRYGSSIGALLAGRDSFRPFAPSGDRSAWASLPPDLRTQLVQAGETALQEPWPRLPATLYMQFARNGDRVRFQTPYLLRRSIINRLVLAECVEGGGRFLDAIVDAAWSICEESSWCLPAHIAVQKAGCTLPDVAEPIVDLYAADAGAMIAWTDYLVGDAMATVSPVIRPRLAHEVHERILKPCRQRDDFRWMKRVSNWNPWICSNWLACVLFMEADPASRAEAVAKIFRCLDVFLGGYGADGGCDEGPGYWSRAGASLFDCLELLQWATNGAVNVYDQSLVQNIGRFIYRAQIAGRWFVNFADAPAMLTPPGSLLWRFGRRIGDEAMTRLGAHFMSPPAFDRGGDFTRVLPRLFMAADMAATPGAQALPRDVWLPDIQVMVARSAEGSPEGLTLAAKGGHNDECHNHNDVGQFIIFADGRPLLIDVGVEVYTKKTFGPQRYEIWTMQSGYHNLPTINGCQQSDGKAFAARDLQYHADDSSARLGMDIAPAYPVSTGVVHWRRTMELRRGRGVRIHDEWELSAPPRELTWTLMTPCQARIEPGRVVLSPRQLAQGNQSGAGVVRFDAAMLAATVEEIQTKDANLLGVWGSPLYRVLLRAKAPAQSGGTAMDITAE